MQTFSAVFLLLRNISVCQMKELLEDSAMVFVCWRWESKPRL